jgi:hypothetical protein
MIKYESARGFEMYKYTDSDDLERIGTIRMIFLFFFVINCFPVNFVYLPQFLFVRGL